MNVSIPEAIIQPCLHNRERSSTPEDSSNVSDIDALWRNGRVNDKRPSTKRTVSDDSMMANIKWRERIHELEGACVFNMIYIVQVRDVRRRSQVLNALDSV